MHQFNIDHWDQGRLTVNQVFAHVLRANGLTSFTAIQHLAGGQTAKGLRRYRLTTRHLLRDGSQEHVFYLKRHSPPPLRDYVKPLLRLRRPAVGARREWDAMIRFHASGIPTMVPVALGRRGRRSFVLTQGLEGFEKLSDWMCRHLDNPAADDLVAAGKIARALGRIARAMHMAHMHHQDFYLGHLLLPPTGEADRVHVIDLGRVCCRFRLSHRWIIKDLAQLNYSAHLVRRTDRLRFMRVYLGHRLEWPDKVLIRKVVAKTRRIARHTAKHGL